MQYKTRELESIELLGERIDFIASNDRIRDRVNKLSNEKQVLHALVQCASPDDVVWDVGACLGIHSLAVAKHLRDGTVVGFEPAPQNRGAYIDNKAVNELTNVYVSRDALADENGQREFAIRQSRLPGYGRHSFATGDYDAIDTFSVPVSRGDSLVTSGALPQPNIIKIDVEGAEPLAIEGLSEVLSQPSCRDVIVETHSPNDVQPSYEDYGYSKADIIDLLEDAGFTIQNLGREYLLHGSKVAHGAVDIPECVTIRQGDIVEQNVDAIVSSAGTTLRMGSGVAGSICHNSAESFYRKTLKHAPADVGEAVAVPGDGLDANTVIHAVSMPHHGEGQSTPESIYTAVSNALELAESRSIESLAMPAVGCGLGGVSLATGSEKIFQAINDADLETLNHITVLGYTNDHASVMEETARLL